MRSRETLSVHKMLTRWVDNVYFPPRTGRPSAARSFWHEMALRGPVFGSGLRPASRTAIMFAVIKTGGKQYKVATNDIILVEKLDAEEGASVTLGEVLMVGEGGNITVGQPNVAGASVTAKVIEQRKGDKVIIFKKNRRHNYRRKRGHRQFVTVLKIEGIKAA